MKIKQFKMGKFTFGWIAGRGEPPKSIFDIPASGVVRSAEGKLPEIVAESWSENYGYDNPTPNTVNKLQTVLETIDVDGDPVILNHQTKTAECEWCTEDAGLTPEEAYNVHMGITAEVNRQMQSNEVAGSEEQHWDYAEVLVEHEVGIAHCRVCAAHEELDPYQTYAVHYGGEERWAGFDEAHRFQSIEEPNDFFPSI